MDFSDIIDQLSADSFSPAGDFDFPGLDRTISATVGYFAARGWDAVRSNGDSLTFVRFSDEGARLMHTTTSGVINSEATFSADRFGVRMFLQCAALRP